MFTHCYAKNKLLKAFLKYCVWFSLCDKVNLLIKQYFFLLCINNISNLKKLLSSTLLKKHAWLCKH